MIVLSLMPSLAMQLIGREFCMGNLVGMPVIVVPAGFSKISNHIVSVLFPSGSDTSFF